MILRRLVVVIGCVCFLLAGSGELGAAESTASTALPVLPCKTDLGSGSGPTPWAPNSLPVTLAKRDAKRLVFYSNGFVTVLAPKGWACTSVVGASGGQIMSVFPPGQPNPTDQVSVSADAIAVVAELDWTGHNPGIALVCDLFPRDDAVVASGTDCPAPPKRQRSKNITADVTTFFDPPHVEGSGNPSGGKNPASGVVIYPQVPTGQGSVDVAKETCTLPTRIQPLCSTIVADFMVRAFPTQSSSNDTSATTVKDDPTSPDGLPPSIELPPGAVLYEKGPYETFDGESVVTLYRWAYTLPSGWSELTLEGWFSDVFTRGGWTVTGDGVIDLQARAIFVSGNGYSGSVELPEAGSAPYAFQFVF